MDLGRPTLWRSTTLGPWLGVYARDTFLRPGTIIELHRKTRGGK